jgi:hypothetical protein
VKSRLAFFILAALAMHPVRASACKVDDASAYGMRDVSGDLLPQRCKEGGDCRIYDLSGRQIGAVGDMQLAGTNSEGLIGFRQKETDLQGFIDASGAVVVPASFKQVKPFCEGLAAVQLVSLQWIFIDRVGKQIGERWEDAESFSNGRAFVSVSGPQAYAQKRLWLHGYVDHTGKLAIPAKFAGGARNFSGGRAAVQLVGEKWGYIDRDGNVVIAPRFASAGPFHHGRAEASPDSKRTGLIDETGKFVIAPRHDQVAELDEAPIWRAGDVDTKYRGDDEAPLIERLYDRNGRPLSKEVFDGYIGLSENLISACRRGKCGYLDASAKSWVIPARYKLASGFSQGLAAASLDGKKWGFIDATGKFVVEPLFDGEGPNGESFAAGPFADGLAPVGCKGRWGFINEQGAWAVPPLYRFAEGFEHGFASVTLASGVAHIRRDGTPIDFATNETDPAQAEEKPCGAPLAGGAKWR